MIQNETFLGRTLKWMSRDVTVCMNGEAYIGAMTLMMTNIAALASFYAGRVTEKAPKEHNDHDEFVAFFEKFFDLATNQNYNQLIYKIEIKNKKEKNKCVIYDDFRCGLVHEYLMKNGTALDVGLDKPYVFLSSSGLTLNIDTFFTDYLRALAKYAKTIKENITVAENFKKRAEKLGAFEPYF
jgi:hypothetical protein